MDFAKRLLDHGFHAPTTYFPLLVPECLLIEPTETESKDILDAFVERHDADPAGGRAGTRARDERTAYHAGAPARRRSGGEATGSEMEADSVVIDRLQAPGRHSHVARPGREHARPARALSARRPPSARNSPSPWSSYPWRCGWAHTGVERALLIAPDAAHSRGGAHQQRHRGDGRPDRLRAARRSPAWPRILARPPFSCLSFLLGTVWLLVLLGR